MFANERVSGVSATRLNILHERAEPLIQFDHLPQVRREYNGAHRFRKTRPHLQHAKNCSTALTSTADVWFPLAGVFARGTSSQRIAPPLDALRAAEWMDHILRWHSIPLDLVAVLNLVLIECPADHLRYRWVHSMLNVEHFGKARASVRSYFGFARPVKHFKHAEPGQPKVAPQVLLGGLSPCHVRSRSQSTKLRREAEPG